MAIADQETTAAKRRRANDTLDDLERLMLAALTATDHLATDGDDRDR